MLDLDAQTIVDLPIDELAMLVLPDLRQEWNVENYANHYHRSDEHRGTEAQAAIDEAIAWLYRQGLIADSRTKSNTFFITRAGQEAMELGREHVLAGERLSGGLHPLIERRARRQFLLGEHEQAVFVAMKAVEIRVRELSGLAELTTATPLMNKAFADDGPLSDPDAPGSEVLGMRFLFAGAMGVLRNPAGHRDVSYSNTAEVAEAVTLASLLMRLLDGIEQRLDAEAARRMTS